MVVCFTHDDPRVKCLLLSPRVSPIHGTGFRVSLLHHPDLKFGSKRVEAQIGDLLS